MSAKTQSEASVVSVASDKFKSTKRKGHLIVVLFTRLNCVLLVVEGTEEEAAVFLCELEQNQWDVIHNAPERFDFEMTGKASFAFSVTCIGGHVTRALRQCVLLELPLQRSAENQSMAGNSGCTNL